MKRNEEKEGKGNIVVEKADTMVHVEEKGDMANLC